MKDRYQRLDSDEARLPQDLKRVGYDADTQIYTFQDVDGSMWQSEEGNQYGQLRRTGTAGSADSRLWAPDVGSLEGNVSDDETEDCQIKDTKRKTPKKEKRESTIGATNETASGKKLETKEETPIETTTEKKKLSYSSADDDEKHREKNEAENNNETEVEKEGDIEKEIKRVSEQMKKHEK